MAVDKTLKQKLLGHLTPEEAALLHWLADECGIRSDDPLFSLLIAMHHYETLLKTVPQELANAVAVALNQTLTVSGTMQSQLEAANARHLEQMEAANARYLEQLEVTNARHLEQMEAERQGWQQQITLVMQQLTKLQASSQQLKQAFDQAAPVQATLSKTVKQAQRQWEANTVQPGQAQQQWAMVLSQGVLTLIGSMGWFWVGTYGLAGKVQPQPLSQTIGETAQFWQWNRERLALCQKDNNPKCTVWITPPTAAKQP